MTPYEQGYAARLANDFSIMRQLHYSIFLWELGGFCCGFRQADADLATEMS